ncbi:MAG: hypothetical protein M1837_003605 [Sclerophora amabilis]|nr:MAG: hypothetical protein M1837_003605 [Sclerophora amabilis]
MQALTASLETLESLVSLASSHSSADHSVRRPRALQSSKSFSRLEPAASSPLSRSRAAALEDSTTPEYSSPDRLQTSPDGLHSGGSVDVFDRKDGDDDEGKENVTAEWMSGLKDLPEGFDELPIELISLTDRFVESLSAKVHPYPPSIDKLSTLFQDFYVTATSHISTHISTLSTRQHRQRSPVPSVSSRSSTLPKAKGKAGSTSSKDKANMSPDPSGVEQQMLTTSEIADRRKARKMLEKKRLVLEETVERRACEGVYDRIWRHRSSHDEEQDEKLRSKTAALGLVGIGLQDLGIGVDAKGPQDTGPKEEDVREWLTDAREELVKMNDEHYPLGKLLHLKAAHKNIVDSLSRFYPSSSSADEILPTLIYTLITTPAEGINIISNLLFIQRFRTFSKVDGEAAYCLTNLEAAISFLETVDLASLREDESPSGPPKSTSRPSTPTAEGTDPLNLGKASTTNSVAPEVASSAAVSSSTHASATLKSLPSAAASSPLPRAGSPSHHRRLSHLLHTPTNSFGAASDAVKTKADQGLKTVSSTLENSYMFLFGRLKERQLNNPALEGSDEISVPRTLDDARRLMDTPSPLDEDGLTSIASSTEPTNAEDRVERARAVSDEHDLLKVSAQDITRERSVDSIQRGDSPRRVSFAEDRTKAKDATTSASSKIPSGSSPNHAVESMKNLGNTLNPLNRLAGINVMRPFGRTVSSTPPALSSLAETSKELGSPDLTSAQESRSAAESANMMSPPAEKTKTAPPMQRFMELENPGDLTISEVLVLLRDYRRLAGALKDTGAF